VWKKAVSFLGSLLVPLKQVNWKPDYKGSYTKEEEAIGQWRTEIRLTDSYGNIYLQGFRTKNMDRKLSKYHKLWEHTMMRPDHQDPNALDNMKPMKRMGCDGEIDDMLRISLREAESEEEIFTSVAWIRAFNINEPIYAELYHELGGRAYSLTLLEFAHRLGLYHADELEEDGFNVYFEGGLRSDEHFNAQDYWYDKIQKNDLWLLSMFDARHQNGYANVAWVIARWIKRKGAGTQKESQIYYGQFISKIARKYRVLTKDVVRSLSALIYCRDLDTITLRDLIDSDARGNRADGVYDVKSLEQGFLTLTPLPSPTPLTNRASTLANSDPVIIPAFVEANYEVLESFLRDRRRQVCNKDLRTELDYYSEEYDEERERERYGAKASTSPNRDWSRVERESDGRRPSERRVEECGSRGGNLHPLLTAHLGRSENGHPLQLTLTSGYTGNQPSTNLGGNLRPNDSAGFVTPFVCWIEDYPLPDGLKMPSHIGSYDGKGDPTTTYTFLRFRPDMVKWTKSGSYCLLRRLKGKVPVTLLLVENVHEDTFSEQHISTFVHGLKTRSLVKFLSSDLPTTYKGLMEKTYTWIEVKEVATNGAPSDHREGFDKFSKGFSWDNNKGRKKNRDKFSSYKGSNYGILANISKSPRDILATEKAIKSFEQPLRMVRNRRSHDISKYCHFHEDHGYETNQSRKLRHQIKEVVKSRQLAHVVKGKNKGKVKTSDTQLVEEGQKKVKETILEVTKDALSCVDAEERIIVNDKHPEQTVVIGKQLLTSFKKNLQDLMRSNADVFAWTYDDMIEDMLIDIQETFDRLPSINMKLNSKKCSFGVEDGPFLGHLITKQGIKANPQMFKAIINLKPLRTLKEI
ncbi:hypothetical protein Tco_1439634, partial [Tanacetum coccineum]